MKAFTGFAIGTLAVLGAVAAVFIYLKKKTEKEIAYDQFDDIMDSDEDFDDEFPFTTGRLKDACFAQILIGSVAYNIQHI